MSRFFGEEQSKKQVEQYARLLLKRLPDLMKEELRDTLLDQFFHDLAWDLLRNHARPHQLTSEEIVMLAKQRLNKVLPIRPA